MAPQPLRFGTRASTMALAQTRSAMDALRANASVDSVILPFQPVGDRDQTSKLDTHGGKGGAFVAEIRAALRDGRLDVAMHSLKDMPGDEEAPGLVIGAYLARESAADALVLRDGVSLSDFEKDGAAGRKIGTNAVRRAALLRGIYPNADIIHYRGAADTRIAKLDAGALQNTPDGRAVGPADALVMAAAGLARIGASGRAVRTFTIDEMLPAVGQGTVALECRRDDFETRARLAAVDDPATRAAAEAEREMLWILNGHCNAPIAGHALADNGALVLRGAVIGIDGAAMIAAHERGPIDRPRALGRAVGMALLAQGADALIQSARVQR